MPINNGSNLKVTTNVGGRLLEDEEFLYDSYKDNKPKQRNKPLMQAPLPPEMQVEEDAPDAPVDEKLNSAIDNDLKKRGIKKRTKKTTTD